MMGNLGIYLITDSHFRVSLTMFFRSVFRHKNYFKCFLGQKKKGLITFSKTLLKVQKKYLEWFFEKHLGGVFLKKNTLNFFGYS